MEIISKIITNVLTALYQPFWFAVILSVLFMFVYSKNCKDISFDTIDEYYEKIMKVYR